MLMMKMHWVIFYVDMNVGWSAFYVDENVNSLPCYSREIIVFHIVAGILTPPLLFSLAAHYDMVHGILWWMGTGRELQCRTTVWSACCERDLHTL